MGLTPPPPRPHSTHPPTYTPTVPTHPHMHAYACMRKHMRDMLTSIKMTGPKAEAQMCCGPVTGLHAWWLERQLARGHTGSATRHLPWSHARSDPTPNRNQRSSHHAHEQRAASTPFDRSMRFQRSRCACERERALWMALIELPSRAGLHRREWRSGHVPCAAQRGDARLRVGRDRLPVVCTLGDGA